MTDLPNHERLRAIMDQHQLGRKDVAALLGVSPHTVSCWRTTTGHTIGDREIDRLLVKLENKALLARIDYLEKRLASVRGVAV